MIVDVHSYMFMHCDVVFDDERIVNYLWWFDRLVVLMTTWSDYD